MIFRSDRKDVGTVSFALLGVLIVLLSVLAVAYLSRIQMISYENELRADEISELEERADNELDALKSRIKLLAVRSAYKANRKDMSVSTVFQNRTEDFMDEYEEKKVPGAIVKILNHSLSMDIKFEETDSINKTVQDRGGYDRVSNDQPGELDKNNETYAYKVEGSISLRVKNPKGLSMDKEKDFTIDVDVPYPFLKKKCSSFNSQLSGEQSHVARITDYIITTLAQYRTLMGYGMRKYENIDNSSCKATSEIITKKDVELAVNMAFLLETAYQYRTFDDGSVREISNRTTKAACTIRELVDEYIQRGRIDPGDIVSLYYGYGYDGEIVEREDSTDINLTAVISQAINALSDQFVFKYLDYFHYMEVANIGFKAYQALVDIYEDMKEGSEDIFSHFLSGEEDEINPEQVETVKNWVAKNFISAGLMNTNTLKSNYYVYDEMNGKTISGYPNLPPNFKEVYTLKIRIRLKSPEHRWYTYDCGHGTVHREHGHTCNESVVKGEDDGEPVYGRCGGAEVLYGYDFIEKEVKVTIDEGKLMFTPRDLLEDNDKHWQEFYDDHYKKESKKKAENIRGAVKEVISKFIESVLEDPGLEEILTKYTKLELDPYDRRSLFKELNDAVSSSIDETMDYYQDNPGKIVDAVLDVLHDEEGDPRINDLKKFLKKKYGSLSQKKDVIDSTAQRTAEELSCHTNPYLEYDVTSSEVKVGKANTECDYVWKRDGELDKQQIADILQKGGTLSGPKIEDLQKELKPEVEAAFDDIRDREISEVNEDSQHSDSDGLIIQALDSYQYNTSVKNYQAHKRTETRSRSTVYIEDITPDPATRGQHVISFQGDLTGVNASMVSWISNIDGHLSNKEDFNMSAGFLSPGTHVITFEVVDEDGFTHSDSVEIFVNLPPKAEIGSVSPSPASETEMMAFHSDSTDPDGSVIQSIWTFGDGTNETGKNVNHTFMTPDTYNVTLDVWDDCGGHDNTTVQVLVDNRPRVLDILPSSNNSWNTDQEITVTFSEKVDTKSLAYSISPNVDFTVNWHDNDTRAVLTPSEFYFRYTEYELTIDGVKDVDNGTNSSLMQPQDITWTTMMYPQVTGIYPSSGSEITVESSIIMTFDERVEFSTGIQDLIDSNLTWQYSFEKNGKRLVLDHEPFPPGADIDLEFDLSALQSRYDGAAVTAEGTGTTLFSADYRTKSIDLPEITYTYPVNGSENISKNENIRVRFSKPINKTTFNLSVQPHTTNISFAWVGDDEVVISHETFEIGVKYKVFIKGEDENGSDLRISEGISNPFVFKIKESTRPEVIAVCPEDGNERYLSDIPLHIVFSEPIKESSLEFTCHPYDGSWEYDMNADGTMITLHHGEFESDQRYWFNITDVEDLYGNSLKKAEHVEFKTSKNGEHIQGNLFQRKVWSIIGGGSMTDSLFELASSFLKTTTTQMIMGGQMSNLEYRLPVDTTAGFSHGEGERELKLRFDCTPDYISLDNRIDISKPKGVHYTKVNKISSRPFSTDWKIQIDPIEVDYNVSRADPTLIEDGEPRYVWMNHTENISFSLELTVYSGWKLAGVKYKLSDDVFSDAMNFLNKVWKYIKKPLSYLIDGIEKIMELFDKLVDKLKEYATKLVQKLGDVINSTINDLLRPKAKSLLDKLKDKGKLKCLDKILSITGLSSMVNVTADGYETSIPKYENNVTRYVNISLGGELFGTSYRLNLNVLESDVIAFGKIRVGKTDIDWQVDPLADPFHESPSIYPAWFQCQGLHGKEGDGTYVNLTIPKRKTPKNETEVTLGEYTGINEARFPIGPVVVSDVDLGFQIVYLDVNESFGDILVGLVNSAFRDTADKMGKTKFSLDYIINFVKTMVMKFIEEVIEFIKEVVQELVLFFQATVNEVQVTLTFALTGGESIASFVTWIATAIKNLIMSIVDKKPSCSTNEFPMEILDDTYLGVEVGKGKYTGFFSANVPAIASLIGKDMGRSKVEFGVKGPDYHLVAGEITEA
ncbi:MAG: Ig-like domain-containing protein [Thermoplasmata archaeon]